MKTTEIRNIIDEVLNEEVKNAITNEGGTTKRVKYHVTCEGEPLATFDTLDEAKDYCEKNKDGELKGKKKLLIDKKTYGSYQEMIDHLDEIAQSLEEKESTELKESENMENQQPMEGNGYIKAMLDAKEKGEDTFDFDGETHDVKEVYSQLEEEEGMCEGSGCSGEMYEEEPMDDINEGENKPTNPELWSRAKSMAKSKFDVYPSAYANGWAAKWYKSKGGGWKKKSTDESIEMNEGSKMCEQCGNTLMEDGSCNECSKQMYESKKKKVRLTEKELTDLIGKLVLESIPGLEALKKSHGQASGQDLKDSTKKIDDYLNFSGNTDSEFPNQNGAEEDKEAYRNTSDEEEFVDTYRGKGLQDLDYDNKPSKEFIDRLRMALEGDSKMGNGQKDTANTTPSKVGEKMFKSIDKEKKTRKAEPMYKKDPAPVTELNESEQMSKKLVSEEIQRIKNMTNYNKKTQ